MNLDVAEYYLAFCRRSPGNGRPCPAPHGMVDDPHRTARRPCCTARGICDDCRRADDGVLLVAMFEVHLRYGFSSIKLLAVTATGAKFGPVGYQVILLYIACLAALAVGGSAHWRSMGSSASASRRKQAPARAPQFLCRDEVVGNTDPC